MYAFTICRDVDQVHDIMDDLAEQHELVNEMSEAISKPVGFGQEYDEVGNVTHKYNILHVK